LEAFFEELTTLLWGVGITSFAILCLLLLPKKISLKLGQYPLLLAVLFFTILFLVISVFN
tara:strand:+ start:262 stop:441 length:180 start_codon:yes stop_codon:yes gene_type:complete